MVNFDGRVAIVTGAGHGLGTAYAKLLAARGAKVLVNDRGVDTQGNGCDATVAQSVVDAIVAAGGTAIANGDTVATRQGADHIVQQAMDEWGQVDILINNAGIVTSVGTIAQMTDEMWNTDLEVAAGGTFQMCRAVWDHMVERDYGRILNVSSGSFLGMGSAVGYPAAKGATWGITRGLATATDFNNRNIKINCIMPTAASRLTHLMGEELAAAMLRYYSPESAAPVVAFLVHEDVPCNGEMFRVGGRGFKRVFIGTTKGWLGDETVMSIEDARDHFAQAMQLDDFAVARNNFDSLDRSEGVNWDIFKAFVN